MCDKEAAAALQDEHGCDIDQEPAALRDEHSCEDATALRCCKGAINDTDGEPGPVSA